MSSSESGGRNHSPKSGCSDSRSASPVRRRSRSRSSDSAEQFSRLHICNFDETLKKDDIRDAFGKFGDIDNVWLASYPPLFAFVTFKMKESAEDALREMNNTYVGRNKIKVATAHPPRKPGDRGPPRRFGGSYGGFRGGSGGGSGGRYPSSGFRGRGSFGGGGGGYGNRDGGGRYYSGGYRSNEGSGERWGGSNGGGGRYSDRR